MKNFTTDNYEELLQLVRDLCKIPAPSGMEEKRAQFCLDWLRENGAKNAYIDSALNVVFPYNCDNSSDITVFVAHTDTVFPDTEPMPFSEDEEKMYSPGIGDDTACVAVLLMMTKYLLENNITPKNGILIVCNSCEEGLGNLKGTKEIMRAYEKRIKQFISFDIGSFSSVADRCVGSHRYEVEVKTPGGHSFGKFGNKNAIAELAKIVVKIYELQVPAVGDSRTTYNVGNIEGGTSVNTIAQSAKMLCEYRSDNSECLDIMKDAFENIFESAKQDDVEVNVKTIGIRPCEKGVDPDEKNRLRDNVASVMQGVAGSDVRFLSMSTDCNIPLSMGIPAVCMGVYIGGGSHTREEWIDKESLKKGLQIAVETAIKFS